MSNWPQYYKDLIHLGNSGSTVGIVPLWTICNQIIKYIDPDLYAAAGQLYTKNGINYLIRNLLANKKIRYLIICGQDRSGSGEELKKLWQEANSSMLHKEIKKDSLEKLTKNVNLIDMTGIEDSGIIIKKIMKLDQSLPTYGQNETFPETKEKDLTQQTLFGNEM